MKKLLFFLVAMLFFSCSDESPLEADKVVLSAKEFSGCIKKRTTELEKITSKDSSFHYTFGDKLKVDFLVKANCCPENKSFFTDYKINNDTIFVTVVDTTKEHCYCLCNFNIHLEFEGLKKRKYLFYCDYNYYYDSLNYREKIIKK